MAGSGELTPIARTLSANHVLTSEVSGRLHDGCAVDDGADAVGAVDGLELEELGDVEHHGTDHHAEHVVPVREDIKQFRNMPNF